MKLGFASASKPLWPKIDFYCDAARTLGHDVTRITHPAELPDLVRSCDLVFLGQKDLAGHWPNTRAAFELPDRCPLVYLWFDLIATDSLLPIAEQPIFQTNERMLVASDIAIVKERSLLPQYRAAGVNAWWCDQGCPVSMPAVQPVQNPEFDLLVWGQGGGHYRQRQSAIGAAVAAGFKVGWASAFPVPPGCVHLPWAAWNELPALASRARCVLSVGRRNDLDGYLSDGFWFAVGMGACVIRRQTPGIPEGPYWTFADDARLIEHLTWARKYPETAIELGQAARKWVMEHHTCEHRMQDLLRIAALTAAEPDGRSSPRPMAEPKSVAASA